MACKKQLFLSLLSHFTFFLPISIFHTFLLTFYSCQFANESDTHKHTHIKHKFNKSFNYWTRAMSCCCCLSFIIPRAVGNYILYTQTIDILLSAKAFRVETFVNYIINIRVAAEGAVLVFHSCFKSMVFIYCPYTKNLFLAEPSWLAFMVINAPKSFKAQLSLTSKKHEKFSQLLVFFIRFLLTEHGTLSLTRLVYFSS